MNDVLNLKNSFSFNLSASIGYSTIGLNISVKIPTAINIFNQVSITKIELFH